MCLCVYVCAPYQLKYGFTTSSDRAFISRVKLKTPPATHKSAYRLAHTLPYYVVLPTPVEHGFETKDDTGSRLFAGMVEMRILILLGLLRG
jgi:hypothetical protein